MSTPGEMMDALEALNLKEIVTEALEEQKEQYVKLNLEQLYQGLNPEGEKIVPKYRSNKYARLKAEMNPAPGQGTPDFKLTGDLYNETMAQVEGEEIVIDSTVSYMEHLEDRWGTAEIWGLDQVSHEEFVQEILQPIIVEKVSEQTGLT